jgi:hypothetical protein
MVNLDKYLEIISDRPYKLNAEEVKYEKAPEGSVLRCASCLHYFRRAIDGFAVCEIFRNEETDTNGVKPDWRCVFWNIDADVYPLYDAEEKESSVEIR